MKQSLLTTLENIQNLLQQEELHSSHEAKSRLKKIREMVSEALIQSQNAFDADRTREAELEREIKNATAFLEKTEALAKVGGWELDLSSGKVHMSKQTQLLHEIDENYVPLAYSTGSEWYPPEVWPRIQAAVQGAIEHGKSYDLESPFITAKGRNIWVRVQGHPLMKDGKVTGLVGTFQDITERKLLEQESHRLTMWQNAVLDGSTYAIISATLDGSIVSFNKAAERMLGYKAEEVIGKTPSLFHDYDEVVSRAQSLTQELQKKVEPGFNTFIAKALVAGSDTNEWTYIRKDSTRFRVRLCVTAIYEKNHEPSGFVGIAEDITREIEQNRALEVERAKATHNAKLASLGEISAGIAHEINNPLAIISGSVRLVMKHMDNPEKLASHLVTIEKSCHRIEKIVSGLKKFSRTNQKGNFALHSLADIAKEVSTLIESKSKRHNTPVTLELNSHALIHCDEVEIEQVLVNLIHNSIDAVQDRTEKWVHVSIFEKSGYVFLRVTDSGLGIPKEIRDRLFEPFYTTKKVGEGTGLGLSIAKGILDEHKSTIALLPDTPNTCFEIRFSKAEVSTKTA